MRESLPLTKDHHSVLDLVFKKFSKKGDLFNADELDGDLDKNELRALLDLQRLQLLKPEHGKLDFHLKPYFGSREWVWDKKVIDRLWPILQRLFRQNPKGSYQITRLIEEKPLGVDPNDIRRALILLEKMWAIHITQKTSNGDFSKTVFQITREVVLYDNLSEKLEEDSKSGRYWAVFPNTNPELPKPATTMIKSYTLSPKDMLHPEIESVAGRLYNNRHYAQAVEESFKRVISEVKGMIPQVEGQRHLDGDPLMNKAFGFENQEPIIRFNELQTQEQKDEQRGIMFLFKGIVGIRNRKAHENVILDDPKRALDYLHMASGLMRLLELSKTFENEPDKT